MASSFLSPPPPSAAAPEHIRPSSSYHVNSLLTSLLIIAALLAFVFVASFSIHLLLRSLSRSRPPPPLPQTRCDDVGTHAEADGTVDAAEASADEEKDEEGDEMQRRLIESLPRFTMVSALAALPKSSPDCAVCLSPFTLEAELRLLPACRHAFHAACVDAWLRTTPTCPLCRATVSFPHPSVSAILTAEQQPPPPPEPRSRYRSRSFRVEMGSISNRGSSTGGGNSRTYSIGSFDYHIEEEVEAVVSRMARAPSRADTIKEEKPSAEEAPPSPGEAVAETAGSSQGWLREYVDRLASSASSFTTFSGRLSSRWNQSQSHRQEEPWLWDTEAVTMSAPGSDGEETAFMVLYRWIAAV